MEHYLRVSADDDAHEEVHQREDKMHIWVKIVTDVNHTSVCALLDDASTSARKREEIGKRVCAAREGANHWVHHGHLER